MPKTARVPLPSGPSRAPSARRHSSRTISPQPIPRMRIPLRAGEHQEAVGLGGETDEDLAPADLVAPLAGAGRALGREEVRARVRLGEREARQPLAAGERGKPALLLLLGAGR